jgi:hypothetical protein
MSKKFFVVMVDDFETKIITQILERNNKKFLTIKEGKASDQINKKIEIAIKNKRQIIFIGCEPEDKEWREKFGDTKYKVITHKDNKKEKSIIKQIESILKKDILSDFERVIAGGVNAGVPGMTAVAEKLGMSDHQKQKVIRTILSGDVLYKYKGMNKKALKDAEKAVRNRMGCGYLAIVDYDYSDVAPIADLMEGDVCKYDHIFIRNKKENKGVLITPNYDLVKAVQTSLEEDWTTKKEEMRYQLSSRNIKDLDRAISRSLNVL